MGKGRWGPKGSSQRRNYRRDVCEKNKKKYVGSGKMAQWLSVLATLPEDPGSIPSTYMATHNCL